jgi:hypothetical protein
MHDDVAISSLLDRAVSTEASSLDEEVSLMQAAEQIGAVRHGHMLYWRTPSENRPVWLTRLASRPYFAEACITAEASQLADMYDTPATDEVPAHGRMKQYKRMMDATVDVLLGVEGVPEALAASLATTIADRVCAHGDNYQMIPFSKGGEVLLDVWQDTVQRYIDRYREIGPERAGMLYEAFGILNLQRYSSDQLDRMCRLAERDPLILEKLRENDFT